jgi:F0F1-type ATP synthase assembly protein I
MPGSSANRLLNQDRLPTVSTLVILASCVLVSVSSLMIWVNTDIGYSFSGREYGGGLWTLTLAITTAVVAVLFRKNEKARRYSVIAGGGLIVCIALLHMAVVLLMRTTDLSQVIEETGELAEPSVASGLWLTLVGGVGILLGLHRKL